MKWVLFEESTPFEDDSVDDSHEEETGDGSDGEAEANATASHIYPPKDAKQLYAMTEYHLKKKVIPENALTVYLFAGVRTVLWWDYMTSLQILKLAHVTMAILRDR